jgi:hypothetical protein
MAKLLKVEPTPERLALAVERSTADRMRQLEKVEGSLWASTKGTRQDMSFIRAATDCQWKTGLPEACIAQIEDAWGDLMESLGYARDLGYVARPVVVQNQRLNSASEHCFRPRREATSGEMPCFVIRE